MIKSFVFFIFLFCSFSLLSIGEEEQCIKNGEKSCCLETSEKPPFYISDEYLQGDKQFENFRDIEDDSISDMYLPRLTLLYVSPDLYDVEASNDYRLPFEVASVPNDELEVTTKGTKRSMFKNMFKGIKRKTRAKKGDVGFIDKRSIRSVDKYTFIVKENTPAYSSPKGHLLNGKILRPILKNEMFLVRRCCYNILEEGSGERQLCRDHHLFDLVNSSNEILEKISNFSLGCNIYPGLAAIPKSDIKPVSSILNILKESSNTSRLFNEVGSESLEIILKNNQWKGSKLLSKPEVRLIKFPMDRITKHGPCNTRHYTSDDKGDTDSFISPYAGCNLMKLACNFEKECEGKGCEVQFGNLYHKKKCSTIECQQRYANSKKSTKQDIDLEQQWRKHKSHSNGECIDIRPFRTDKDDIREGLTWAHKEKYDHEKTKKFIEMAIKNGATDIYFNDPELILHFSKPEVRKKILPDAKAGYYWDDWWRIGGRKQYNHDDHIHLCFKADNPRVKKSCNDGL